MDKSGSPYKNINKKPVKHANALYLILKENPVLTRYYTDKNLNNIRLKNNKTETIPDRLHYWIWSCINSESIIAINNSITIKLADIIFQNIDPEIINIKSNSCLSQEFYYTCANNLSDTFNDHELLLLYLKQTILILKSTSIFGRTDDPAPINDSVFGNVHLYLQMLNSFWNKMNWALLFPSMPETALNLMKDRKLLVDLLARKNGKIRIDSIANAFFKATGSGRENDILLVSFLDFGVLTWLGHFGIISYIKSNDMDPVLIEVTKHGKKMLEYLALE